MARGRKKPRLQSADPEVFHVEVITKARVTPDLKWEYMVKWGGYDSDADSWEPAANVRECTRLLQSFWFHIGLDEKDYPAGYEVEAKPEWIIKERQYFAKEIGQQKNVKQKPKKSTKREQTRSSTVSSAKGKTAAKNITDDSESDNEPLVIRSKKRPALLSDDESTTYSKKKLQTNLVSTSISSTTRNNKGKEKETTPESPTSLFSGSSSPEVALATLPSPTRAHSGSGPSRTASTSLALNHKERQTNPRVKLLPLERRQIAGGSGLSTKQRLAQSTAVQTSTNPKAIPARNSLTSLSFKKRLPPPTGSSRLDNHETKSKSPVVQESSSPVENRFFSGDIPETARSPKSMTSQDYIPLIEHDPFDTFLPSPDPHVQEPSSLSDPIDPLTSADVFLQSVMPKELAAPLTGTIEKIADPIPPRALVPRKPLLLPKIPKKWKWAGKLLMDTAREKSEGLCDIALTDATEHLAEGLRLSVVFSSMDSIRFSKLHNVSDLDIVLRACKPAHQLAKLGPQDDKDANALKKLVRYMDKRRQVTCVPLSLDNAIVGILLVFPATMNELYRRFKVPAHLQQNDVFISVLLPWALPAAKRQEESRKPYYAENAPLSIRGSTGREITLKTLPNYHRATHILQFPKWLHDFMSQPVRPYCVWWTPADGTAKEPGIETELLHCILKQCQAKDVGHKTDVRAVFVHVGALKTLHKLPALAERRSKRPEIQFFTYGTHEDVPPDQWGVRGIFPLGGIVTFTPNALAEDPIGAYQLMTQLVIHRLWECYILPSTIGMATKLISDGVDPLIVHDKGEFIYDMILAMIENGDISLIGAPPTRRAPLQDEDPVYRWVGRQFRQLRLDSRGLLEACMKDFDEQYSNIQESEWSSAIETEICNDMLNMQCQPVLMDEYRRFVVIKTASDNHIAWDRSGLEWLSLSKFSFKDDYFK